MDQQKVVEILKELALEAGKVIMDIYETDFSVDYKDDSSPLTMADKQANALIVEGLQKNFPNVPILSEEVKDDKSRRENHYCFVVDPLDGTKEFVKRNGEFTVNIALVYQQKPIVGVIYVPVSKDLYFASLDGGSFKQDGTTGEISKLQVSQKTDSIIWVGSKSHSTEKENNLIVEHEELIGEIISAGSSLKGCLVAEQKADVYYRFGLTCEWDTAAMHCIAETAGAIIRQMDHTELLYNREDTLNAKGFYIVNCQENVWV